MPSTMRTALYGLLVSGASAATVASKAGAAKYIVKPGEDGGSSFRGLSDALKDGGAQGLIAALSAMKASGMGHHDGVKIKKDEDGQDMYDFVETTAATTPLPTHAPLPARLPQLPMAPRPPAVAAAGVPQLVAAAAPAVGAPQFAAAVPQAWPLQPPPAAFATGGGGGALPMLAAGLAAVRSQVDALAAEANAAVGGNVMAAAPQAQANPAENAKMEQEIAFLKQRVDAPNAEVEQQLQALTAKVATPPQQSSSSPKVEAELMALTQRMEKLETENEQLKRQVTSQDLRLQQLTGSQNAEEKQVANLTAEDAVLRQALMTKHRLRHRKHKAQEASPQAAEATPAK